MAHDLKTQYKYIYFTSRETNGKTRQWICESKDSLLGLVKFYPQWRQYCFFPFDKTHHNSQCLEDIAAFLNQANKLYRNKEL